MTTCVESSAPQHRSVRGTGADLPLPFEIGPVREARQEPRLPFIAANRHPRPETSGTLLVGHSCSLVATGLVATLRRMTAHEVRAWDEVAASGHERFRGGIDVIIGDAAFLADAARRAVGAGAARADRPMSLLIGADAHDGRAQEAMPMPVDACLSLACRGQELVDVIVRLVDGCRAMRPPAARGGSDNALAATPAPGSRDAVRSESGPMGPRRFEGVELHAPRAFGQAIPGRHDAAGAPPRGGLPPGALRRVRETMESRLTDKLRLRELAAVAGVSEYHFARAFKQSVGHPPHQYLMMRRIAVAAELVKATDRALIDISLETGFSDQSHFSRMFARITGETPRAYRRRHR